MGTQKSSDMLGKQLHNYNPVKYGYATCLPHKDGGIPLSALPKDTTSKLAGLFYTLSLFMLSAKQGSCEYHFLKSFGMTRLRNEPQVYQLQCGRSNHCTIAPVTDIVSYNCQLIQCQAKATARVLQNNTLLRAAVVKSLSDLETCFECKTP